MKDGRTYQQCLVWEKLTEAVKTVELSSDKIESRASLMTSGSTMIVAIIAGANMFPKTIVDTSCVEGSLIVVLCGLSLAMFWLASNLWGSRLSSVAATGDVDKLYDEYIAKDEDTAFNNALIDLAKVFECSVFANQFKKEKLNRMVLVLQMQLCVLAIGVLVKSWCR